MSSFLRRLMTKLRRLMTKKFLKISIFLLFTQEQVFESMYLYAFICITHMKGKAKYLQL